MIAEAPVQRVNWPRCCGKLIELDHVKWRASGRHAMRYHDGWYEVYYACTICGTVGEIDRFR